MASNSTTISFKPDNSESEKTLLCLLPTDKAGETVLLGTSDSYHKTTVWWDSDSQLYAKMEGTKYAATTLGSDGRIYFSRVDLNNSKGLTGTSLFYRTAGGALGVGRVGERNDASEDADIFELGDAIHAAQGEEIIHKGKRSQQQPKGEGPQSKIMKKRELKAAVKKAEFVEVDVSVEEVKVRVENGDVFLEEEVTVRLLALRNLPDAGGKGGTITMP